MKLPVLAAAAILCVAYGFQLPPSSLRTIVAVSGLQSPVAFVQDPSDPAVFLAVEQAGRIRVTRNGTIEHDFLDLRNQISAGGERGLLGLVLATDYAQSGRFFVNFTNRDGDTVIARFRRSSATSADPASRFDLRWGPDGSPVIAQPFSNHNGGHMAFGPDGYLYIGLGDGGSANDPQHRAQTPSSLLGKFLRIDVNVPDSHAAGYVVPPDNPFLAGTSVQARPEVWSFGVRNPWRFSFDDPGRGGTGAMLIGDVGQGSWEEVDYEPRGRGGRNYGWRNREGAHPNVQSLPPAYQPLIDPIHEYERSRGQSITGGYVYRGRSLGSRFNGRYFFADYVSGRVWSLALTVNPGTGEAAGSDLREHTAELGGQGRLGNISSFATDREGELLIVSHNLGSVLRLAGGPPAPENLRIIR